MRRQHPPHTCLKLPPLFCATSAGWCVDVLMCWCVGVVAGGYRTSGTATVNDGDHTVDVTPRKSPVQPCVQHGSASRRLRFHHTTSAVSHTYAGSTRGQWTGTFHTALVTGVAQNVRWAFRVGDCQVRMAKRGRGREGGGTSPGAVPGVVDERCIVCVVLRHRRPGNGAAYTLCAFPPSRKTATSARSATGW